MNSPANDRAEVKFCGNDSQKSERDHNAFVRSTQLKQAAVCVCSRQYAYLWTSKLFSFSVILPSVVSCLLSFTKDDYLMVKMVNELRSESFHTLPFHSLRTMSHKVIFTSAKPFNDHIYSTYLEKIAIEISVLLNMCSILHSIFFLYTILPKVLGGFYKHL